MSVFDPYGYLSRNDSISHRGQIIQPSPFFSSIPIHPSYIEKYKQFLESYGYHIFKTLPSYFKYTYSNIVKYYASDTTLELTFQRIFIEFIQDNLPSIDETFQVNIYIGLAAAQFNLGYTASWTGTLKLGQVYTFNFNYPSNTQYIHLMSNTQNYFFFSDNATHNASWRKEITTNSNNIDEISINSFSEIMPFLAATSYVYQWETTPSTVTFRTGGTWDFNIFIDIFKYPE